MTPGASLALVTLALCGCLPAPRQYVHRPDLRYFVSDTSGRPVAGALTKVYSADHKNGSMHTAYSTTTVSNGESYLSGHTDTHIVWWLIPGMSNRRHFAWCVSAPGHASRGARLTSGKADTVRVRLLPAAGNDECPEYVRSLDEVVR